MHHRDMPARALLVLAIWVVALSRPGSVSAWLPVGVETRCQSLVWIILVQTLALLLLLFDIWQCRRTERNLRKQMRAETKKALHDREQWFSATLKSIRDAVITTDNEGKITFMNPAAEFLTGWHSADMLGREIGFRTAQETDLPEEIEVLLLDEEAFLITKGGTAIPVEYSGAPIQNEDNQVSGMVMVLKDITERKHTQEELRQARDQLEARVNERTAELAKASDELRILGKAVETMQLGVTIVDAAGRIMYMNPADAQMHGYTVTELLGQNAQVLAPPELRKHLTPEEIEAMRGWIRESLNLRKNGSVFPVYLTSSVVRDETGNFLAVVTTCEDITERKRTQAILAEERNLLRTLIETIPDQIYVTDIRNRIVLVNRAEGPTGDLNHTEDFESTRATDNQEVLTSGRPILNREELSFDAETGELHWFSTTKVPLRNNQGKMTGLVVIRRNITEQKETEIKIEHINSVLRAIQEVNPIIVREKNRHALIQQVCEGLLKMQGFQAALIVLCNEPDTILDVAETGIGQEVLTLQAQLETGRFPSCFRQALEQADALLVRQPMADCPNCALAPVYPQHQKILVRLEHNHIRYGVLLTIFPDGVEAYDEDKALLEDVASDIAFALYSIDVEENRKQAETSLQHERQRLFDLLENLPVYVYLQSPDYSIRFANRAFRERFGEPERGRCYRLLWGRGEAWEESPSYQVFYTRQPQVWEWNHYPTQKIYQVYDYPFTDFDGAPLLLELGIDITERKHMELALQDERALLAKKVDERTAELSNANQQLQQEIEERKQILRELQHSKEAAESANQAKSEFLANMSHELRTPLNAVLGYAQILKTAENLTERQVEGLEIIKSSGQHLLNLINELLDLSKIEAGQMQLEYKDVHFPEFLRSITEMIRIRAEQNGLGFVADLAPDLPQGVRMDERKLRQVLLNLLGNAVKFTETGCVTLRVKRTQKAEGGRQNAEIDGRSETASCVLPSAFLTFEVEDTGVGIEPSELETIFLPFHQVGEQMHAVEGTGLGLTISRNLVRMLGGELSVRSTPGQGSLFWFDLPLAEIDGVVPQTERPHDRRIIGYKGVQRTLLIADDRRENRTFLVHALLPLGFHVLEAENGHECVEQAYAARPDAILLDLRMPLMDGFDAARHIRKFENLAQTPIIAISASAYEEIRQKSLQAGCNLFLTKPIELDELLDLLQSALHIEWIYAEHPPSPVSKPEAASGKEFFLTLPDNHIQAILAFAAKGRAKKLLAYLAALEQSNPAYTTVIQELREYTKHFQFNDVINRVHTMRTSDEH